MKVKIKKLFHGFASVRDYKVQEAVERGQDLIIQYQDEQMTVFHQDLLTKGLTNNFVIYSKHNNKSYKLIDYDWIPDSKQIGLFL